jgi:hypothetical protein
VDDTCSISIRSRLRFGAGIVIEQSSDNSALLGSLDIVYDHSTRKKI